MERLPNLRHLRAFLTVGTLHSVNRAGAAMNLSQPAVTQAIARLERSFCAHLFLRHPTGMYPTEDGTILLSRVQRMFDALGTGLVGLTRTPGPGLAPDLLKSIQLDALAALTRASTQEQAAGRLGVTVAAMSRNVKALESRLDAVLLLRDGGQLKLSTIGHELARAVKLAQRELELAREELSHVEGRQSGRLSVGALPMARTYITPKALTATGMRFPALRVQMVEGGYELLLRALRDGDIDFIVGTLREPAPAPDVAEVPLFTDRLCVVARTGHPLAALPAPGLEDFLGYPWIAPRMGSPARTEFDAIFPSCGRMPPRVFEVASHMAVRSILRESDTLALISRHQIRYEERDGQLMVLSETLARRTRTIGYTVRAHGTPTRIQSFFLEQLAIASAAS